jgi:ribosome-associated protein
MSNRTLPPLVRPDEVSLTAIRAQGAGGQNVNKVSSAIHLRFDIRASSLPDRLKERLLDLDDRRITRDGVVVLKAQRFRHREQNEADALARLDELVRSAGREQRPRVATKPTAGSRKRRLEAKAGRSQTKALRRPVRGGDD